MTSKPHSEPVVLASRYAEALERIRNLEEQYRAALDALRAVPYAITMALQWTVVPSDVPEKMHAALGDHRKMLASVHDTARAALEASSPAMKRDDA